VGGATGVFQMKHLRNRLTVFDREVAEETGPTWRPRP